MPDLTGAPAAEAEQALADARLVGAPSEAFSADVPAGDVISQDPEPGTSVPVGATVAYQVSQGVEQVAVPDLTGAPAAEAEQALADARLVGAPSEAFSADVPAGDVISQDPEPGTSVPVGATVAYQVSQGVEQVAVPDLTGAPAAEAEQALADARLVGAPSEAFSADVPAGDVISQDPEPGTSVPVGATVAYQVSQGVEQVAVPDLTGAPAAEAEQALADARLVGAPSEAFSADVPAGDVISQDPAPGTSVPVGATVAYQVSQGVEQVAVPDLTGAPAAEAEQALADARLVGAPSEAFSADVPAGDVISQDPEPGTSVPVGATVAYQVSQGVEQVAVPDLTGAPAAEAEQALADARLVGAPSEAFSADVPAGDVISQDPEPGTSVPVGATVAYQVSQGVEQVAVPDLTGAPAAEAEQALADARLVGAPSEAFSADVPAGDVISQDPEPGTSVPVGATVAYQVSQGVEQVAVPDLTGAPAAEAEQALADARLVGAPSEAFSADVPAGDVISQDPAPGTSVPVGATVAYQVSQGVEQVAVPDLTGAPAAEAEQALADARLVGAPSEAFSADVPAGDVISQDPEPGTSVPVGATVAYQVSQGVEQVAVPDLTGAPAAEAEQALADARLVGAPSEAFSADVPAGDVISQDPEPGTSVPVGATVAYQVSQGVEQVAVPDLTGAPAAEAEQALADARLVGAPSEAFSADVPAGDVISQDPEPGTSVPVGATVAYQVSQGVEQVAVPDLTGAPAAEAEQALADARLVGAPSEAFSADVPAGDVISQDPEPGTSVPVGATVAYQVSQGVEQVAVPDLTGAPAAEAEQALADARLVGAPSEAFSADVPAGDVISQDPEPGTSVPVGATVAYQVSQGVEQVAVPDLTGAPAAEAEQALADARLVGAPSEAFSADVPAGDVISQDPEPGTSVPVGATVAYQVSQGVEQVAVPDLTSAPAAEAEQALADARLVGAPSEAFSADVPAGDVISQDPEPGTSVPVGATVAYQVSQGVEQVAVPDLTGAPAAEAEQALADARLVGAPSEAFSADVPAGDVISQDPEPGTSVPVGATVAYQVSQGVEQVAVPDLTGAPAAEAEQALADARLVGAPSEAFSADVPAGDVISQDPEPGTSVPVGATVAYQVSQGVEQVAVPDLTGAPAAEAEQALADARLVGAPSEAFSADVPAGDVISQDPEPGTSVPVGATVAYQVSQGVESERDRPRGA